MKSLATEIHEIHELDRLSLFAFPLSGSVHQNAPKGYQRDAIQLTAQMGQIWLWEHLFKVFKNIQYVQISLFSHVFLV